MFWKEKRVERKLEREIGRKERELAGSTDPMQRGSLLEELVWLKEERGDLFGAISALLDKFKEDRKVDTLKKLRPILEKHSEFDLRELEERLFESGKNLDRTSENDLLEEIYNIDGKLALRLSLRFFDVSKEHACGLRAIDIMERLLSENGREHDVYVVETAEEYRSLVGELVEISPDRGGQILARAAEFSEERLGNLEFFLDFSLRRFEIEPSHEVRCGILNSVIEKFDNLATVFEERRRIAQPIGGFPFTGDGMQECRFAPRAYDRNCPLDKRLQRRTLPRQEAEAGRSPIVEERDRGDRESFKKGSSRYFSVEETGKDVPVCNRPLSRPGREDPVHSQARCPSERQARGLRRLFEGFRRGNEVEGKRYNSVAG